MSSSIHSKTKIIEQKREQKKRVFGIYRVKNIPPIHIHMISPNEFLVEHKSYVLLETWQTISRPRCFFLLQKSFWECCIKIYPIIHILLRWHFHNFVFLLIYFNHMTLITYNWFSFYVTLSDANKKFWCWQLSDLCLQAHPESNFNVCVIIFVVYLKITINVTLAHAKILRFKSE